MLTFRDTNPEDSELIYQLMYDFYRTDAVCHPAPKEVLDRTISAATDPNNTAMRGVLVYDGDEVVGYMMLTSFFSGEVGGLTVMVEQVYVSANARGKGVGRQMMAWLKEAYPQAYRFQLEVNHDNPTAIHVYEKADFTWLPYRSMIFDTDLC